MPNRVQSQISALAQRLFQDELTAPRTILVIDDEEGVRKFVERVRQGAGYRVVIAPNGPEALRIAEAMSDLDLIVTDVMMPDMSGCELARRLRLQNPNRKVLYVTGYSDRIFEARS
jgi:CheY-like chemotaxis protein